MREHATAPDLYSYGRTHDDATKAREAPPLAFVCVGCGSSVAAHDPELVRHLGWRLLTRTSLGEPERPVLCPRCARRSLASLR